MDYSKVLFKLFKKVHQINRSKVNEVSTILANSICKNQIIYFFGCGHSHIIGEDCFYRAGGLANIQPIFDEKLMLHVSASESSFLEKDEKNGQKLLDNYDIKEGDILILSSVSGINGVPIEVAIQAKRKGMCVIGIGSSKYFSEESRHSSKKKLYDVCDLFLDNCVPKGDAIISLTEELKSSPVSTPLSTYIVQWCLSEAETKCIKNGFLPPVFGSGNLTNNVDKNKELVKKYKDIIKSL